MTRNGKKAEQPGSDNPKVRIGWDDVARALKLLETEASGAYWPSPLGNCVRIDFANETDASLILDNFKHARRIDTAKDPGNR